MGPVLLGEYVGELFIVGFLEGSEVNVGSLVGQIVVLSLGNRVGNSVGNTEGADVFSFMK